MQGVVPRFVERGLDRHAGAILVVVGIDVRTDVADAEIVRSGGYPGTAPIHNAIAAVKCRNTAVGRSAFVAAGKLRCGRLDRDGAADAVATTAHRRSEEHTSELQ